MDLILFYLRKLFTVLKNEVLVLPSRVVAVLFFLILLLLPLFTKDAYLLRIFTLTSIFAILAASWDLLSGFTGQMNFGHALFLELGPMVQLCSINLRVSLHGAASLLAHWVQFWQVWS